MLLKVGLLLILAKVLVADESLLQRTYKSLDKVFDFFKENSDDVMLDGLLGMVFAKSNLEILLFNSSNLPQEDKKTLETLIGKVTDIVNITKSKLTHFNDEYDLFETVLLNSTFWSPKQLKINRLKLPYHPNKPIKIDSPKDYIAYVDSGILWEPFVDYCFSNLITEGLREKKSTFKPDYYHVSELCKLAMISDSDYCPGYVVTHQLLYLMIGRGVGYFKDDDWYLKKSTSYCSYIYWEAMQNLKLNFIPKFDDILLEQITFCGMEGFQEFLDEKFISHILNIQTDEGCFAIHRPKRVKRYAKEMKFYCNDHTTGDGLLLGMGNPLLDISAKVEDNFLAKYDMKANDAILASDKHKPLYKELTEKYNADFIAGGSVQNSLRVAQWILEKPKVTTFFGCVGEDDYSKILEERARADGVNVQYQYNNKEPTGTCAVLITGHHRSLCANLAAANCFTIDHIRKPESKKLIDMAQFFYISGFFLTVSPESILEVAKHALAHNKMFIMNLSAPFISQFYKSDLMQALPYVDLLFGNETEAETFASEQNFDTKDLKEIALKICNMPKQNEDRPRTVIITTGSNPVILAQNNKITEYAVTKLDQDKMVDTNGAGDAFVGGFLAQFIRGQPYDVCIKCGIWTASEIIQRSGCTYEGKATFKA